jgi:hypothetical protein
MKVMTMYVSVHKVVHRFRICLGLSRTARTARKAGSCLFSSSRMYAVLIMYYIGSSLDERAIYRAYRPACPSLPVPSRASGLNPAPVRVSSLTVCFSALYGPFPLHTVLETTSSDFGRVTDLGNATHHAGRF